MAQGDQLLFLKLAEALGQPSRAYRAAQAGLDIPLKGLEGYQEGAKIGDEFRQRKLKQQTLADALGGQNLEQGIMNLTGESGTIQNPNIDNLIALAKAEKERKDNRAIRMQQVPGQLFNGRPGVFDPSPETKNHMFYADTMEPINFGASSGTPAAITPRVAPTVPAGETEFFGKADTLKNIFNDVRSSFKPEYVGPVAGRVGRAVDVYTPYGNADRSHFRNQVAKAFNNLVYLRSGKQINQEEANRMAEEFMNTTNSPVAFQSALNSMQDEMNSLVANRRKAMVQSGYRGAGNLGQGQDQVHEQRAQKGDPLGLFK